MIIIRLTGNGFLYNMVRIIVGTLMEVGRGVHDPSWVKEILNARDRNQSGVKAPAQGLTLVSIRHLEKLQPLERNTNDWIDYTIDRSESEVTGKVYMYIHSCVETERERMIRRTANHAFRDGASELWVADSPGKVKKIIKKD